MSGVTSDDLRINRNDLDGEVVRQPELLYAAAEAHALAVSKRDHAAKKLDEVRAIVDHDVRELLNIDGEKYTEKMVTSAVDVTPDFLDAQSRSLKAKRTADLASALRDAFHQRAFVLRDLVSLYVSGYYSDASIGAASRAGNSDARNDDRRKRMHKKRVSLREDRDGG